MARTAKQAANLNLVTSDDEAKALESNRRNKAVFNALCQLEAIFDTIVVFVQLERGEIPERPDFDDDASPDVILALAIRGRALSSAIWQTQSELDDRDKISTEDLERVVFHG